MKDSVDKAVIHCINNGIMTEFLKNHRAEVMDVCITEYNEKTFVDGIREEGREEERIKAIRNMIELGLTKEQILMKYSEKEYEKAEQEMLANV